MYVYSPSSRSNGVASRRRRTRPTRTTSSASATTCQSKRAARARPPRRSALRLSPRPPSRRVFLVAFIAASTDPPGSGIVLQPCRRVAHSGRPSPLPTRYTAPPMNLSDIDFAELYRQQMLSANRQEKTPEDWDGRAPAMSQRVSDSQYVRQFVAALDLEGCATLLDVGCGPGTIALTVAPRLERVYGLDYSPGMLAAFAVEARARPDRGDADPPRLGGRLGRRPGLRHRRRLALDRGARSRGGHPQARLEGPKARLHVVSCRRQTPGRRRAARDWPRSRIGTGLSLRGRDPAPPRPPSDARLSDDREPVRQVRRLR